ASSLDLIKNYPDRIGYLHLKQINPEILKKVNEENMTWAAANLADVMTEPPNGLPDLRAVIEAVEALNRPIFGIVEQDMYPVAFDVPMPIAKRTRSYLLTCGSRTAVN
ncbi:MAG: 2-keto-myo-inositol dehydratase, partial [Pseudarthrobacter sp.]|nr:2-keto-myo-inositol dehydratase [Pseudarthrobacter sp.]